MENQNSPFHPDLQNQSVNAQITAALERVAESLRLLLWTKAREYGLSPIQVQVLIFLHSHPDEQQTLSYLAKEFSLTKATLSDVIRVLVEKKLVQRKSSRTDARSQILALTSIGKKTAAKCGTFANSLLAHVARFDMTQKLMLKESLFSLIHSLFEDGLITIQRMCYTCTHFTASPESPFCNLLKIKLTPENLRLDCPEHEENTGER